METTQTRRQGKTRLRLAYLTSRFPAPSSTFILNEVRGLRARGHAIDMFAVRCPGPETLPSELRSEIRRVTYLLPVGPIRLAAAHASILIRSPGAYVRALALGLTRFARSARERLFMFFYLAEAVLLAEHLRRRGLRHVHVHHANAASLVGLLAARLLDIGFSFTAHGSDILLEGDHFEEKIAASRFVITVSEFNRKRLMAAAGRVERRRIRVVRTGVDLKRFRPSAARPGSGPKRLLAVGRLHPVKGLDHLIDALTRVREAGPDFQLDLIGDGPLRDDLQERIERAGLSEQVHLHGAIGPSELPRFYAKADLFVLSSLSEGLPVVLMEAMASGLPVVATRITGVPELVQDGVSGILVPPGEPEPLASAIRRLLADPLLAGRLGRAGRRSVEREFDLDANVDRLDGLLRIELHELVESVDRP